MPSVAHSSHSFGSGGRSLGPPARVGSSASMPPIERLRLNSPGQDRRPSDSSQSSNVSSRKQPFDISDSGGAPAPSAAPPVERSREQRAALPPALPATTSYATPGGHDYRDAFRVAKSNMPKRDESNAPKFRAAVEAERWRAKLSGESSSTAGKYRDDKLDSYRQPAQAEWARERLLGAERKGDEEREEEELDVRRLRAVAQAWKASAEQWVDVAVIDRLEDTLRRRLGELESSSSHAGHAARKFFSECDPQRQGRLLLGPFVGAMERKLNYDFPARGAHPGSRDVLAALFRRYDIERSGMIMADDFHSALTGASRPGRASGRVVNAIGRLREGLVRCGGGYDALRQADARWFAKSVESKLPTGCLTAGHFVDELLALALACETPLSEADLVTLLDAFEPPKDAYKDEAAAAREAAKRASDPLVSFDEVTLALRGPAMGSARVQITRAAYQALKDDAKVGIKTAVKPVHLADRYDVSKHPAVRAGHVSDEEAAMAFLHVWREDREALDKEINVKEFCDRYEWISPLYDDDDEFDAMMRKAWRLK